MVKYLKLLFVALFATTALSLTSCGKDDNDEPKASGSKGELTIDGTKYAFDIFIASVNGGSSNSDYSCLFWNKKDDDRTLQISVSGWNDVNDGYTWTSDDYEDDDSDCYLTITWSTDDAKIGHGPTSGTVKVTKIDKKSNKVTMSFNHAEFEYYDGSYVNLPKFSVDGTITMPIDGSWGI